jgi:hypothetical protein
VNLPFRFVSSRLILEEESKGIKMLSTDWCNQERIWPLCCDVCQLLVTLRVKKELHLFDCRYMYRLDKSRSTETVWWEIKEWPVGSTGPWPIRKRICFYLRSVFELWRRCVLGWRAIRWQNVTVNWVTVCCEMLNSLTGCSPLCTIPDHSVNVSLSQVFYFKLVKIL